MKKIEVELLQLIVNNRTQFSSILSTQELEYLYTFCIKHSILALTFPVIESMEGNVGLKRELILSWYGATKQIEIQNDILNRRSCEATAFFKNIGFDSIILKGQSNNFYYPNPKRRTPGDIDIWVMGKRSDIIRLVKSKCDFRRLQFLHADYKLFSDVDVEVHFYPGILFNYFTNKRLQRIFERYDCESRLNKFGEGDTCFFYSLPYISDYMMQLAHLYRHLFIGGFGFRHLLDMYFLITSANFSDTDKEKLNGYIKECDLVKFNSSIMFILCSVMGLKESKIIGNINQREGIFLLNDVLDGGNFGHYNKNTDFTVRVINNKLLNFIYATYNSFRVICHYPKDCFWFVIYRVAQAMWRLKYRHKYA